MTFFRVVLFGDRYRLSGIRQIGGARLRIERPNQVPDLAVDLGRVRNSLGDVLAQPALELAPQPVHGGFDCAFGRAEPFRDRGVAAGRRALQQRRLQLVEIRRAPVGLPFLTRSVRARGR